MVHILRNPPSKKKEDWLIEQYNYWCFQFGIHPHDRFYIFKEEDILGKTMDVADQYPYRTAEVSIYPLFWTLPEAEQRQLIIHEVMHLVLWELTHNRLKADEIFEDMEERVVEALSMGIANLN